MYMIAGSYPIRPRIDLLLANMIENIIIIIIIIIIIWKLLAFVFLLGISDSFLYAMSAFLLKTVVLLDALQMAMLS
jgi:hypothetical protein